MPRGKGKVVKRKLAAGVLGGKESAVAGQPSPRKTKRSRGEHLNKFCKESQSISAEVHQQNNNATVARRKNKSLDKPKGKGVLNQKLLSRQIRNEAMAVADELEQVDREFEVDPQNGVEVDVDPLDEQQFPGTTSEEDNELTDDSESDRELSDGELDCEEGQDMDVASVAPSKQSSVITFKPKQPSEFEHLKENPAFQTFVKKLVAEELQESRTTPKRKV